MKQQFKRQIVELLNAHRIMTIATNRPDGWPQATVVGYANDGLIIYCLVARDSQKFANISRDPRVSIAIANDYPQPLQIKGLSLAGRAVEASDPGEIDHVMAILLRRYPEYKVMPRPNPAAVPMLRITPEIVSILDYSKGFGHTDLVRVTESDLAEYIESRRHNWAGYRAA
ncbi:MAG TPA: pyridoxamine 5'-phosphate oxidase family protein [Xanthobacteraceae bacterium]|jgi:nitroimidazol reductase NimA-like FMN-containing flavoprotein (pyridoxamine 5'-phosphate oxidase superfamily)|nr:pyridoxamine 5'-phosphate oxidase family protein [Xanthobacteraceae bacterium]